MPINKTQRGEHRITKEGETAGFTVGKLGSTTNKRVTALATVGKRKKPK